MIAVVTTPLLAVGWVVFALALRGVVEARGAAVPRLIPTTALQCCPTSDGAGAAILCSSEYAAKHGRASPGKIVGQALTTDLVADFADGALGMIGVGMTKRAAAKVYEQTGIGPEDVDVIELHDCF